MVRKNTANGFTLLELLIAIVLVGVLASIALPSYLDSVRKGRRSDAVAHLQRVQQAQERHRANNMSYTNDLSSLSPALSATSPDRYYTVAVTDASASGYTATATPMAGSSQASDSRCAAIRLTQTGGNITYSSTRSDAVEDAGTRNPCWNR